MTVREVWEGVLTELSKVHAPSMLLQDFNYFFNKAINQYINKRYNIYDINLQTTDDLRVLKSTAVLSPLKMTSYGTLGELSKYSAGLASMLGATYEVNLPLDYLHLLNCVCVYKVKQRFKCYNQNDYVQFSAKRLTADAWSVIINDYYNRPLPWRPYYYIHNVNTSNIPPYNPINDVDIPLNTEFTKGTDAATDYSEGSNLPRTIFLKDTIENNSLVDKEAGLRYGNATNVRMEIRYGSDDIFTLEKVFVDYIKSPLVIRLTLELVNLTLDTSLIMEFPDYVCQEIINELTMLVMENTADPRLQTSLSVTQSIANPAQQLTPQPQPLLAQALQG